MDARRSGIQPCGFCELLESRCPIILVYERDAQVQVSISGIRLKGNNSAKALNRLRRAPCFGFELTERTLDVYVLRIDLEGRAEFLFRFGKLALPRHGQAQIYSRLDIFLILLDGLPKKIRSLLVLSLQSI